MDTGETLKLAGTVATALGGSVVALARWYSQRAIKRDEAEAAERARDEERADRLVATLIEELRQRIIYLEKQVERLHAESCILTGCKQRPKQQDAR